LTWQRRTATTTLQATQIDAILQQKEWQHDTT
jgi:hypothetical protein